MSAFFDTVKTQRWDDHRYYHQSRINQSLHFVSALSFLIAYAVVFFDPALAALIGWGIGMTTRQSGHFFFEPKGHDHVNDASFEHKEAIKVGYNMFRKTVLIGVWALIPVVLYLQPSLFGLIEPATTLRGTVHDTGMAWLALAVAGLCFRVLQLTMTQSLTMGVAWAVKIITDPFYDIAQYWRSPYYLLRGQLLDPMEHIRHQHQH